MSIQISPNITTFSDLLYVINTNSEWRQQLVSALFPELNIQETLETLIETNRLLREDIALLQVRFGKVEIRLDKFEEQLKVLQSDVAQLKIDVAQLKIDVKELKHDNKEIKLAIGDLQSSVGQLKGDNYENQIVAKINSVLGPVLRRGRDARNEISDHLDEAEDLGTISEQDNGHVLSSDLLWQGIVKKTREPIFLVGEASWLAELHDVERAVARAQVVQQAGLNALSVVAGQKWTHEAIEAADRHGIVRIRNFALEPDSWTIALS